MVCAACAGLGVFVGYRWPFIWIFAFIALAGLVAGMVCKAKRTALLLCFVAALFAARASLSVWKAPEPIAHKGTVTGRLVAPDRVVGQRFGLVLTDAILQTESGEQKLSHQVSLRVKTKPESALRGKRVTAEVTYIDLPNIRRNPGGWNARDFEMRRNIAYIAYADQAELSGPASRDILAIAQGARMDMLQIVSNVFPADVSGVMGGLLFGGTQGIEEDTVAHFRTTGVAHILSVSGLHVGFIALLAECLLRLIGGPIRLRIGLLVALLAMYALLCGLEAAVLRSTCMLVCARVGLLSERRADPPSSLAFAAMIVWMFDPMQLFNVGFQMSFAAVVGILLLQPVFAQPLRKLPKWLGDSLSVSIAAQIGIAPISASVFGTFSVIATAINLWVIPITSVAVIAGIPIVLLYRLWPYGMRIAAIPITWMMRAMLWGVRISAEMPFAQALVSTMGWEAIVALLIGALILSRYWRWRDRRRFIGLALCVALALSGWVVRTVIDRRDVSLLIVDVGQGSGAILHAGRFRYIIDTGPSASEIDRVAWQGGARMDGVFITHPHEDHFGALTKLMDRVYVKTLYLPCGIATMQADTGFAEAIQLARERGIDLVELFPGDVLQIGNYGQLDVLAGGGTSTDVNEQSLILRYSYAGHSALFMADAGAPTEESPGVAVPSDVLIVGHHGSNNSSTAPFLQQVKPTMSLISVGERNQYGHPAPGALERIQAVGARIERTDLGGALRVTWGSDGTLRFRRFIHP